MRCAKTKLGDNISKGRHLHESNESLNCSAVNVNERNDGINNSAPGWLRRCKCRFCVRC